MVHSKIYELTTLFCMLRTGSFLSYALYILLHKAQDLFCLKHFKSVVVPQFMPKQNYFFKLCLIKTVFNKRTANNFSLFLNDYKFSCHCYLLKLTNYKGRNLKLQLKTKETLIFGSNDSPLYKVSRVCDGQLQYSTLSTVCKLKMLSFVSVYVV